MKTVARLTCLASYDFDREGEVKKGMYVVLRMWYEVDLPYDLNCFFCEGCDQAGVESCGCSVCGAWAMKQTRLAATMKLQHLREADGGYAACLQFGDASNVRAVLDVRERMMKGES